MTHSRAKPDLPADISMESFLQAVTHPTRWINNFKYGYTPSMEQYDRELFTALIQEIRTTRFKKVLRETKST